MKATEFDAKFDRGEDIVEFLDLTKAKRPGRVGYLPMIWVTFGLSHSDERDRIRFSKQVLPELRGLDEVERADRAEVLTSENGAKGFETLVGFLTAEVTRESLTEFLGWMSERFADKALKVTVKVGEQEISLEATSRKELDDLEQRATRLLAAMNDSNTETP